jgi:glutathione S-transferase
MKLFNAPTSPFGRKVTVALLELDLPFEEQFVDINGPSVLDLANPLRQVPTLVSRDGREIYDSTVIVEYLDSLAAKPLLFEPHLRFQQLTRMSLADGLMEAVRMKFLERMRPEGEQSPAFIERLAGRVDRSLEAIAALTDDLDTTPRADAIALACALEYTEFRHGQEWRGTYLALANWLDLYSERPSMRRTGPDRATRYWHSRLRCPGR